jgi:hypothetical protein
MHQFKNHKNLEWEYRDRLYTLKSGKKPLTYNTLNILVKINYLWFDPEKGYQRELRYVTNQPSPFCR